MWWRITAPNCRESVLEVGLSPARKIAPPASIAWIRLTISSSGRSGRRATTTSPTRKRVASSMDRATIREPDGNRGAMLSPFTRSG